MVGQHIGKYRVTQQVGRGGMGTVYCAVDETLHREVAIKVLNTGLDDPTVARRFRAEAVTVARLNHPGIATIYELVQHDGEWLMVMELVKGETLEQALSAAGSLPVPRAADVMMQMLAALAHAHGLGVVHRDLKPANLMLTAGGGVKVMDFGIARVAGAEHLTTAGFMMGTPAYMAPEQVTGADIDARTDLYAAGLIFYQLVAGTLPFKGETPLQLAQARVQDTPTPVRTRRADAPEWVGQVLEIALARDPDQRFQTAVQFREAIRRGLGALPIEPPRPVRDLAATAAPGSLRIDTLSGSVPSANVSAPSASDAHLDRAPHAPQSAGSARPAPRSLLFAAAGILMAALAGGGWLLLRSPAGVREDPAVGAAAPAPAPAPAESAVAIAPAAMVPDASAPVAAESPAPAPAPASASAAPASTAVASPVVPPAPPPAAAAAGAAASAAPASSGASVFANVRGFLVNGRRSEERDASLRFADGEVTLTDRQGGRSYGMLPFAQITSAAHTRGKNPKWYPTLAGPAADVDMPGGLFRGDRHWLALQSRAGFLIVRIDDDDWRAVAQAVTRHLGLSIAELPQ